MKLSHAAFLSLLLAAILLAAGCSLLPGRKKPDAEPTVAQTRGERREEVTQDFDKRRDKAQLRAAVEKVEFGDEATGEKMLRAIVDRDPANADARLYLAELLWSHDELDEAEMHLREAVAAAPKRADLHHALGALLDANDQPADARKHLQKAVALAPENELYRLAADTATTDVR